MPPIAILIIGIIFLIVGILCFIPDIIFKTSDPTKFIGIMFLFIWIWPTLFGGQQLYITSLEKKYK